jgi:hypothetical protein
MIELFIIAIVGIAILVLASPSMKGRGYRNPQDKREDQVDRIVDEEQNRAKSEARYRSR